MVLQFFITNQVHKVPEILKNMLESGIGGSSVIDSQGALQVINHSTLEAPPMFGSLRDFLNPEYCNGKIILTILHENQVPLAREIIVANTGELSNPHTGILLTVMLNSVEGLVQ